jgi:hypothetical protein
MWWLLERTAFEGKKQKTKREHGARGNVQTLYEDE